MGSVSTESLSTFLKHAGDLHLPRFASKNKLICKDADLPEYIHIYLDYLIK